MVGARPPESTGEPITELLAAAAGGDGKAQRRLWAAIYAELVRRAQHQLANDALRRRIQPTTLVHEAYLRLVGDEPVHWSSRRHFFAAAAEAMRRIRVDDARKRDRLRRGAGQEPQPLAELPVGNDDPATLLAVDEALEKLRDRDPRKAEIVHLRFFAGLTIDETAEVLGLSPRTVDNEWRFARAWLHFELDT